MNVGAAARPDHLLTLAEWAEMDTDAARHAELADGLVIVTPRAAARHQRVAARLAAALDDQLPPAWSAVVDIEVVLNPVTPATVRAPDVSVVPTRLVEQNQPITAADVLLAVEVVSPGTRGTDRVTKPAEYAAAGIPYYWRIELDDVVIVGARLNPATGTYDLAAPTATLTTTLADHAVTIALTALLNR